MAVGILGKNEGILNCQTCDDKLRQERGHDREGIVPFMVDGKRVFRCPLTFITPLTWEYIKAYSFFEKGLLPNESGWANESHKFIQSMLVLEKEFNEYQNRIGKQNAGHRTKPSP